MGASVEGFRFVNQGSITQVPPVSTRLYTPMLVLRYHLRIGIWLTNDGYLLWDSTIDGLGIERSSKHEHELQTPVKTGGFNVKI